MSIFSKKNDSQSYGYSYDSICESGSGYDNSAFEDNSYEDDYSPDYEIAFSKQLSNGSLIFTIVDDNEAGYVIVNKEAIVTPLPSGFYNFDEDDIAYLKRKATAFFEAI